MTVTEAMRIFGFTNMAEVSKQEISKRYRSWIVKNHPDLFIGNDTKFAEQTDKAQLVNEAIEVLYKSIENFTKAVNIKGQSAKNTITLIINYNNLIEIYNGKQVSIPNNSEYVILNLSNLYRYNIIISIEYEIRLNGKLFSFLDFKSLNDKDRYDTVCNIEEYLLDDNSIEIRIYDKSISFNTTSLASRIAVKLDKGVVISIDINLKQKKKE